MILRSFGVGKASAGKGDNTGVIVYIGRTKGALALEGPEGVEQPPRRAAPKKQQRRVDRNMNGGAMSLSATSSKDNRIPQRSPEDESCFSHHAPEWGS